MIFIDTGFLFAQVSKRDAHHSRVVEVFRAFKDLRRVDHLLTTNHVIAETITLTRKVGHEEAARLSDQLYGEKLARIHWATPTKSDRPLTTSQAADESQHLAQMFGEMMQEQAGVGHDADCL